MEYRDLRITPIDDVIADASYRGSGRSWHTAIYLGPCSLGNETRRMSLLFPRQLQFLSRPAAFQRILDIVLE
jgi:hypothetical protein